MKMAGGQRVAPVRRRVGTKSLPGGLLLPLLALVICSAAALYQDQAGKLDWYKQNVGLVRDAHFVGKSGKHAVLTTEDGLIASLNLRTNKIEWRTLLPNSEVAEAVVSNDDVVFTVSGMGKHASLWSVNDGALLWSEDLYSFADSNDDALTALQRNTESLISAQLIKDVNNDKADDVLVSVLDRVQLLSGKTGRPLWSWTAKTGSYVHNVIAKETKNVAVLGSDLKDGGRRYFVVILDRSNGQPVKEGGPHSIDVSTTTKLGDFSKCVYLDATNELLCLNLDASSLWRATIDLNRPAGVEFKQLPTTEKLDGPKTILSHPRGFVVRTVNRDVVFQVTGATVSAIHEYSDKTVRTYGSAIHTERKGASGSEDSYLAGASITEHGLKVEIFDGSSGKVVHTVNDGAFTGTQHGLLHKVFFSVVSKKDGSPQYRLLLVSQDHSLSFITGDKIQWIREEALAGIVHAEMIELPAPLALRESLQEEFGHKEGSGIPIVSDFVHRIGADIHQLLSLLGVQGDKGREQDTDADEGLVKDKFGLRKLIIATTRTGKIFALHSNDGSVAWSKYVSRFTPFALYVSRSAAHPPPVGVIVGQDQASGTGRILQINLLTGEEVEYPTALDHGVKQSIVLPYTDSTFRHPVLVVDSTNQGHIIPDTQENRNLVAANGGKIHTYIVDKEQATVEGYGIDIDITKPMVLLWNVHFVMPSETIEAIAPSRGLSVRLPVLMRGNNSVTPKYINKNLLAIATTSSNTFVSSTNKRVVETSVGIYLIDTVTGAILHHSYHKNAQGPVSMVQGDNWIVYHLWNRKQHRFEMNVLELFEPRMEWHETSFSSRTAPLPEVVSQSYVFNAGVKTMGITNTARGLTQKQIIVGLSSDRLIGIDKRFVDFRRKPKELLSEDDKNEGVIPYMPELLFRSSDYLNYNNTVYGLRGVQTTPASLESTSLVFAWGIDLFFTRVTPSGTFDMLNEDFEYYPLLLTVSVVVILTITTSYLVGHKNLREAWR